MKAAFSIYDKRLPNAISTDRFCFYVAALLFLGDTLNIYKQMAIWDNTVVTHTNCRTFIFDLLAMVEMHERNVTQMIG